MRQSDSDISNYYNRSIVSQKDLVIQSTPPLPPSGTAQFARIDNTSNPVFSPAQTFNTVPFDLTPNGVDNGQYQVTVTPTYPDGRTCQAQTYTTPPCPNMISVSAVQTGNNIVVNYTAPGSVSTVSITIVAPNGSTFNQQFTNGTNGSTITYPIPTGVYGAYSISMQTVCDATTGFFGAASPGIAVNVSAPITNPTMTGTMTIVCGGNCGQQQAGAVQFNLTAPLSADLTIQMGLKYTTPTGQQGYGCSLSPLITGTCQAQGYTSFVIPAGQLGITIPASSIQFSNGSGGFFNLICFCNADADYSTIFMNTMFLHPVSQPNITISLTATDNRITVTQV